MSKFLLSFVTILINRFSAFRPKSNCRNLSLKLKEWRFSKTVTHLHIGKAKLILSNGWAYTNRVPVGVLGTVWGYTTLPNAKVTQLLASESETEKKESVRMASLLQILMANEGSRIRFQAGDYNEKKIYEGAYKVIGTDSQAVIAIKTETGTLFAPFGFNSQY